MEKIVIISGGGHAKVITGIIKKTNAYDIVGYTDFAKKQKNFPNIKYLGTDDALEDIISQYPNCKAVIGIGLVRESDTRKRLDIEQKLFEIGYKLASVFSPEAIINERVTIGEGSVVFDNVVVNCDATIGKNCILNTSAVIEHDCRLGDNVHVSPGAVLSGGVVVESNTFIGAGATIIQNIKIGKNCFIGAGALVINDINEPGKYVGAPVRRIK